MWTQVVVVVYDEKSIKIAYQLAARATNPSLCVRVCMCHLLPNSHKNSNRIMCMTIIPINRTSVILKSWQNRFLFMWARGQMANNNLSTTTTRTTTKTPLFRYPWYNLMSLDGWAFNLCEACTRFGREAKHGSGCLSQNELCQFDFCGINKTKSIFDWIQLCNWIHRQII